MLEQLFVVRSIGASWFSDFQISVHWLQVIITEAAKYFVVPDSVCNCSLCHVRY